MKRLSLILALLTCSAITSALLAADQSPATQFWPQWRGPVANGTAPLAQPPLSWSETNHVKWKVKIPGYGTSTPIVWSNRVFITTAVPTGVKQKPTPATGTNAAPAKAQEIHQFIVLCLDRATGKTIWQKIACEEAPHEGHHNDHGFASASALTDGQLVFAYFGSRGLHCYDWEGKPVWDHDFGDMKTRNSFGEGASPALFGDTIVVNWDDETDNDFIVALHKQTGKELWRNPRNETTGWSTPLIVNFEGKPQVIVNASNRVRSYDLATGKELWQCGGQTANAIPTPVASTDTVYATSGFRGSALQAIALGRTGDLTGTDAIRWSLNKDTPYVPSPLLADDLLYYVSANKGVISCVDARTGKPHFEAQTLPGISGIYASPVSARDRVYVLGRDGLCLVLKKGPKFEILSQNKLDDKTDASLALAGKDLFVRGHEFLYRISE